MYKITVEIDGMACGMCEAHINDCVRSHFSVKKVESSHKKGTSIIIAKEEILEDKLRSVIEKTGYTVKSVSVEPYEKKGFSLFGK